MAFTAGRAESRPSHRVPSRLTTPKCRWGVRSAATCETCRVRRVTRHLRFSCLVLGRLAAPGRLQFVVSSEGESGVASLVPAPDSTRHRAVRGRCATKMNAVSSRGITTLICDRLAAATTALKHDLPSPSSRINQRWTTGLDAETHDISDCYRGATEVAQGNLGAAGDDNNYSTDREPGVGRLHLGRHRGSRDQTRPGLRCACIPVVRGTR